MRLEERGRDVELDVGRGQPRAGPHERAHLGDRRGQRAAAPQQPLRQEARLLGGVERVGVAHREQRGGDRMVLQVPTDAGQFVPEVDPDGADLLGGPPDCSTWNSDTPSCSGPL
jgi:hypothetical protein